MDLSSLSMIEVQQILRVVRTERDRLTFMCRLIEERLKTMGDGERNKLERELAMTQMEHKALTALAGKLWVILANVK